MSISTRTMSARCFLLVSTVLLTVSAAFAQSTFGTFVGTVQDQSGSVIPGAVITITNLDENTSRSATSSNSGQFEVLNLKPGRYSISATKVGFAAARVDQVSLDARQERRIDLTLSVTSIQQ